MKILLLVLVITLTGCQTAVVNSVSTAADNTLESAEIVICRAATVGSVIRRYGQDSAKAAAWRELCIEKNEAVTEIVQ